MPKVRMLVEISGTRDGERWAPKGETMDLPPQEAEAYAAQGLAEIVDTPKAKPAAKKSTKPPAKSK